jgi:hypothetical protein
MSRNEDLHRSAPDKSEAAVPSSLRMTLTCGTSNLLFPADCVASEDPKASAATLSYMERVLKADIRDSTKLRFES